jgi:hypothetical protein
VGQNSSKDRAHLEKVAAILPEIGAEFDLQEARELLKMGPT